MIEFKIALMRAGLKLSDLAPKLNLTPRYLHYIVTGQRKAPLIRERLVAEFGLPAAAVLLPPQHKCEPAAARGDMKKTRKVLKAAHA